MPAVGSDRLVVSQQALLLNQVIRWVRLDGYQIVSDLIGVSDLFARIKPVIRSLRSGRPQTAGSPAAPAS